MQFRSTSLTLFTTAMVAFVATTVFLAGNSISYADTVTHYVANLSSASVISGGFQTSTQPQTGVAYFTLRQPDGNPAGTTLTYDIHFNGLDLDGLQTPGFGNEGDDVTAVHMHDVTFGVAPGWMPGDTAGTLHNLNIFGSPRGGDDDDDMSFDPVAATITGLWEDTDESAPGTSPAPTLTISSQVGLLQAGDMFLMVHTNANPGGAIGGFLQPVPEPSTFALLAMLGLALAGIAKFRK